MALKEEIKDRVEQLKYKQKQGAEFIRKQISKELNRDVPINLIYQIIDEIKFGRNNILEAKKDILDTKSLEKKDWWLKELVKEVWDDKLCDFNRETDHIILYPKWLKPYPVLRTTFLAMIWDYSWMWANLSWKAIQTKYKLPPKVRQLVKKVGNMYKDSVPFDKFTLSLIESDADMEDMAEERAEQLQETKMMSVYGKSSLRVKDTLLKRLFFRATRSDEKLDAIYGAMKKAIPIHFWEFIEKPNSNDRVKTVFLSDAHLGKSNTDWIVIRFKKLTQELIECPETNIEMTFGGDLGEQFVARWEKHYGTKLGMENINLEDLFILILDVFQNMLLELHKAGKKIVFNGIGWNHDSFEENKDKDPLRSPAMIMYRLLQRVTQDTNIQINLLREKINVVKRDDIKFVYLHWDKVWLDMVKRLAMDHIEDWYYLVIVTWDKHHFEALELTNKVMWVKWPALAGKWKYDNDLAMSSQPWVLFFEKNIDWLIDILLKRYK